MGLADVHAVKKITVKIYLGKILPNIPLLLKGSNANVFEYICNRTLKFGNFTFTTDLLFEGSEKFFIAPISSIYSVDTIRRSITSLSKRGFILPTAYIRNMKRWVVNFPAVAWIVYSAYAAAYSFEDKIFVSELEKIKVFFANNKWNVEEVKPEMDIETAIKLGKRKHEEARKRKIEKKKKKPKFSPTDVILIMKDICKREEIPFFQPALTGKEKGCVRNFVRYCEEEGIDVVKHLENICIYWKEFSKGVLRNSNGYEIMLSDVVDFMQYFKNRREIDKFIAYRTSEKFNNQESESEYKHVEIKL